MIKKKKNVKKSWAWAQKVSLRANNKNDMCEIYNGVLLHNDFYRDTLIFFYKFRYISE